MAKLKLTKAAVDRLLLTTTGQQVYWDTEQRGFGLVVGKTAKSFVVQTNIRGNPVRVTLGQVGLHTCEEYRERARRQLGLMKDGIDPREVERQVETHRIREQIQSVTLRESFEAFKAAKTGRLKSNTIKDYEGIMLRVFSEWLDHPLKNITPSMIQTRHSAVQREIAERRKKDRNNTNRGEAHANGSMRVFRAIYNFALVTYEDAGLPPNPVKRLSNTRAWFKDRRRQTIISVHQLPKWFKAVTELSDPLTPELAATTQDFLLLLLFTGLRRMEAAALTWDRVDFNAKTLTIGDTKNGEPHTLPLPPYLYALLTARREVVEESPFVFPWPSVKEEHIIYPVRYIEEIQTSSGVTFTLHDLRRTFITTAESLDLSAYAVKRLVNHKMSDVTAGYIIANVERLRKPMERISEFLLYAADVQRKAAVIRLDEIRPALANA